METRGAIWLMLLLAACAHPETSEPSAPQPPQHAQPAVETPPWYAPRVQSGGTSAADGGLSMLLGPSSASLGMTGSVSYQYFTAVKQVLATHWKPQAEPRLKGPSLDGNRYYTLLSITLDAEGKLLDAQVEKPSGIDVIDDAALQAFEKSKLPKPPPEVVKDGLVKFEFGFTLDFGPAGRRTAKVADGGHAVSASEAENGE